MQWTEERTAQLRALWSQGLSASQIASELGGTTRNAVIGKAHRLGLASRPSPIKRELVEKPKQQGATILTLTERTCRWPIGHPGEPGFHFCGKKTVVGLPYCEKHAAMAYQPASNKRGMANKATA